MYGLPDEIDLSLFIGSTLEAITFTANTIHFDFSSEASVTLEGSYACGATENDVERQCVPVSNSRLMSFVGQSVDAIEVRDGNRTLRISLGNDNWIELYDDSSEYESFRIGLGDREVIV